MKKIRKVSDIPVTEESLTREWGDFPFSKREPGKNYGLGIYLEWGDVEDSPIEKYARAYCVRTGGILKYWWAYLVGFDFFQSGMKNFHFSLLFPGGGSHENVEIQSIVSRQDFWAMYTHITGQLHATQITAKEIFAYFPYYPPAEGEEWPPPGVRIPGDEMRRPFISSRSEKKSRALWPDAPLQIAVPEWLIINAMEAALMKNVIQYEEVENGYSL